MMVIMQNLKLIQKELKAQQKREKLKLKLRKKENVKLITNE